MDLPTLTILDACAGFGMLAEGILAGLECLGLRGRVVAHIERDSAAAAALVARMASSPVDQAPVWDCLDTFDGRPWRGRVDCICAGLPCQPYSLAGKRIGNVDPRSYGEDGEGPIPHFLRIVGEVRPALVFLENVPSWVVGGHFRTVGEELSRLGYTIEDPFFLAAEDVVAPHERERVFILAHRLADTELSEFLQSAAGGELGDGSNRRLQATSSEPHEALRGRKLSSGSNNRLPLFPPGRGDPGNPNHPDWWAWAAIAEMDASLMPRVEPELSMVAHGLAFSRADLLRIGGNGVVPLAAAYAFATLLADAIRGEVK